MNPAIHDGLRGFPRSHHAIILGRLSRLGLAGKSVTVSTVVTGQNIVGLGDVGRYLKTYRLGGAALHAWHLYKFLPLGRGGLPNAGRLCVDDVDYHRVCEAVQQAGLGFPVYKRVDMYHSRSVGFFQTPLTVAGKSEDLGEKSPGPRLVEARTPWRERWNANCTVVRCREPSRLGP